MTSMSNMLARVPALALALAVFACSSSEFSGSNGSKKNPPPKAEEAKPATPVPTTPTTPQTPTTPTTPADEPTDVVVPDPPPPAPEGAVTQGSFTVWTVPADPTPGESYRVVIEVKLPNTVQSYAQGDLSGRVTGTDGYFQAIGAGNGGLGDIGGLFDEEQTFNFTPGSGRAQLTLWVPGALQLVKDTIDVRSTLLNEQQTISIVF